MKLKILAFGAHPDDVELGCGGTLLKHIDAGDKVGVIDLTRGELGTRGTAETRDEEAAASSKIMGIAFRNNLRFRDGFFLNDEQHQLEVIKHIRLHQPEIVLCNALSDRHTDHGLGAALVAKSCFLSGLRKIETKLNGEPQGAWRPIAVYHYIQDRYIKPDVIVDITSFIEKKVEAIHCFKSQFYDPTSNEPNTPISTKEFMEFVHGRAMEMGRVIGTTYGEGFVATRSIGVNKLTDLL